jgi:hypothetical protein
VASDESGATPRDQVCFPWKKEGDYTNIKAGTRKHV